MYFSVGLEVQHVDSLVLWLLSIALLLSEASQWPVVMVELTVDRWFRMVPLKPRHQAYWDRQPMGLLYSSIFYRWGSTADLPLHHKAGFGWRRKTGPGSRILSELVGVGSYHIQVSSRRLGCRPGSDKIVVRCYFPTTTHSKVVVDVRESQMLAWALPVCRIG